MDTTADILIVDDTPANLQVLSQVLKESGHKVRAVPSGMLALRAVENRPPDLILLDINMPEMDGYTVCQTLKAQPETAEIPVIFISALSETLDKIKAFELGAVDYMTKPFQFEEVQARVRTHLKIQGLQRQLQQQNRSLEASLLRQQELESQRENLVHMMVHDMRSPLTGMLGYLSLLEMFSTAWPDKHKSYLKRAQESTEFLIQMISTILDIHKMDAGQMPLKRESVSLPDLAQQAVQSLGALTLTVPVEVNALPGLPEISLDRDLVRRVWENLLGNALKFSPAGSCVNVRFELKEGHVRCCVCDQGPGIPPELQGRIFEKFGQAEVKQYSTGLGLTFCKMAIEAHGGQIGLESQLGQGTTFWFDLPLAA
ncbi:MAG: hybrid sensor histidine kinase/response regulator [Candidatus Sericytochromatia bacterium]